MYPLVMRQLVDEVAKPLSITFEKSWQSSDVPTDWMRGNITSSFKKVKKEDPRNYSQSHPCAQQGHGADSHGNCAKAHENEGGNC